MSRLLMVVCLLCLFPVHMSFAQEDAISSPAEGLLAHTHQEAWVSVGFGAGGQITVEDGTLHVGMGEPMTGVRYEGDLDAVFGESWQDYEITCKAARLEGSDFFLGMTFPVGKDGQCTLIAGGWAGVVVGLSSLDGLDAGENETTQLHSFKKGQWYDFRVRVTAKKIMVWLEGEQIIDVDRGDYDKIDVRPEVESTVPFGFSTYMTHGGVKELVIKPIVAEAAE